MSGYSYESIKSELRHILTTEKQTYHLSTKFKKAFIKYTKQEAKKEEQERKQQALKEKELKEKELVEDTREF